MIQKLMMYSQERKSVGKNRKDLLFKKAISKRNSCLSHSMTVCIFFYFSLLYTRLFHNWFVILDIGSNNSGFYTLQAVLTHRGRSSSSGHYVGWVRWKNPTKDSDRCWLKCDDADVTPVSDEEVLKLSGGGMHDKYLAVSI